MNQTTLKSHLELELEGEHFANEDLESRRQKHISWIVDQLISNNASIIFRYRVRSRTFRKRIS